MRISYLAHLAIALCIACGKQPSNTGAGDGAPDAASSPLPGPYDGVIYDPDSPHYKDLLESYFLADKHFDLPYTTSEIVGAGEERWLFRP